MRKTGILTALMMFLVIPSSYIYALGPNTVDSAAIIDGQVKTADIDLLAVTTERIAAGAVTDAKITGPISASKLEKPANVIVVAQSGGDFTSITDALASLPSPNTAPVIIKVQPGTYTENITMKSYVNLQGSGRDVTTIEGNITVAWGTTVTGVTISGFKISGGYIKSDGSMTPDQKVTITGNYLSGSSGEALNIYVCSPYFTVSDNIIAGNGIGIDMMGCKATIRNNTITGNSGDGIRNYGDTGGFSSNAIIADNVISNNGSNGIYNSGSSKVFIRNNVIVNNGNSGIYNTGASPTIVGNTIEKNGEVTDNNVAGIANFNGASSVIKDNIIDGNVTGIINDPASSLIIKNNTIRNSSYDGISDTGGAQPITLQVVGNIITGNGAYEPTSFDLTVSGALVSRNVFDKVYGFYSGNFNEKSDGTPW